MPGEVDSQLRHMPQGFLILAIRAFAWPKRAGGPTEMKEKDAEAAQRELDEKDVNALFEKIKDHFKDADDDSHEFFSMLVTTSLNYRDMLVHSGGAPLTVGETRDALDAFMEVMRTHEIPQGLSKRVHDLVIMLLEGLRERLHH